MGRIFWGKCVTKREGGAAGEEKNIVICTGKEKAVLGRTSIFC